MMREYILRMQPIIRGQHAGTCTRSLAGHVSTRSLKQNPLSGTIPTGAAVFATAGVTATGVATPQGEGFTAWQRERDSLLRLSFGRGPREGPRGVLVRSRGSSTILTAPNAVFLSSLALTRPDLTVS